MKKSYWKIHVSSSWVVFTITSLKHEPFYFYYSRSVEHSYILNYKLNTVSKRQIRLLLNRQAVKGGWWAAALAPVLKEDWTRREGFLACGGKIVSCRIFMGICKGMACLCASACQFVCIYSFFPLSCQRHCLLIWHFLLGFGDAIAAGWEKVSGCDSTALRDFCKREPWVWVTKKIDIRFWQITQTPLFPWDLYCASCKKGSLL